jgi:hypothetical protein
MKSRRSTLKSLAALTAGLLVPAKGIGGNLFSPSDKFGELLPLRLLGKTGEKVTMLGLGGAHIARCDEQTAEAQIECAIEGGIRFFDNAHMYGDGLAEERFFYHDQDHCYQWQGSLSRVRAFSEQDETRLC